MTQAEQAVGDKFPKPMTDIEFLVERARVFTYGWSQSLG
jgi:hypothetical protein